MNHHDHEPDINDLGLQVDLSMWNLKPLDRRKALQLGLVGIGAMLLGCTQATTTNNTSSGNSCVSKIPTETAGPYPGDGSNGANALTKAGIVRSDIRPSLATGNIAQGIPTKFELTLVDSSNCTPLIGYAIYAWHCTREGSYSMYSQDVINEDFLRGVQATDSNGKVVFQSIFPACYSGRWPHVHFEVYKSLEQATNAANKIHTSQLALPESVCKTAYAAEGYSTSITNLSRVSLASDMVFGDGSSSQLATVTGDNINGYTATLTIGI